MFAREEDVTCRLKTKSKIKKGDDYDTGNHRIKCVSLRSGSSGNAGSTLSDNDKQKIRTTDKGDSKQAGRKKRLFKTTAVPVSDEPETEQ